MLQRNENNGVRHYYEITGQGDWLVLIHGLAGSTQMWKKEIEYLSKRFKVLNYDLRGHANTGYTELNSYTLKLVADDLAHLMDDLEIITAHFCSLSLGRFTGLTKFIMKVFDKFVGPVFGYRYLLRGLAFTVMPTRDEKLSRKFFIAESKKLTTAEIRRLPKVKVPSLILIGAGDWLFINEAYKLSRYFINVNIQIIPYTGHGVMLENPEECKKQILAFYSKLGYGAEKDYVHRLPTAVAQ